MNLLRHSARLRLLLSAVVGLATGLPLGLFWDGALAAMAGITLGELVFVTVSWILLWLMDAEQTERSAWREDFSPVADEVLIATVSGLAVISMVTLQFRADSTAPVGAIAAVVTLVGVFGAWACVHQTYALHYAHVYYRDPCGGIDFGPHNDPAYSDFLYFSYAVGMTYGATDNTVTDTRARAIVLRHALISFVFGLVILGAAINLVAGFFGIGA